MYRRFTIFLKHGLHQQFMNHHVRSVEGSKLCRQAAKLQGMNAVAIHKAGHLYAAIVRQVIDQAAIGYVAVNHLWAVKRVYLYNIRASIQTPFKEKGSLAAPFAFQIITQSFVMFLAILRPMARPFAAPAIGLHLYI